MCLICLININIVFLVFTIQLQFNLIRFNFICRRKIENFYRYLSNRRVIKIKKPANSPPRSNANKVAFKVNFATNSLLPVSGSPRERPACKFPSATEFVFSVRVDENKEQSRCCKLATETVRWWCWWVRIRDENFGAVNGPGKVLLGPRLCRPS